MDISTTGIIMSIVYTNGIIMPVVEIDINKWLKWSQVQASGISSWENLGTLRVSSGNKYSFGTTSIGCLPQLHGSNHRYSRLESRFERVE